MTGYGNLLSAGWTTVLWDMPGDDPLQLNSGNSYSPALAAGGADGLYLAWSGQSGNSGDGNNLYVARWDGQQWQLLADPLDFTVSHDADHPQVAVTSEGDLWVSWREDYSNGPSLSSLHLRRYNGSAWEAPLPDVTSSDKAQPAVMALMADDKPVVAWSSMNHYYRLHVSRWLGVGGWATLGNELNTGAGDVFKYALTVDANDNPLVFFGEDGDNGVDLHLKVYNGLAKGW